MLLKAYLKEHIFTHSRTLCNRKGRSQQAYCLHLLMPCIFASCYRCRLSVHFVPCCGLAPQCPVVPVCRDNHYIQSSDFLISRIFSIVVLPTLRYLISSSSGIVRKRLTSIISCPFSYRIMFACFSALFAIVKTLSSFMFDYYSLPSYNFGHCLSYIASKTTLNLSKNACSAFLLILARIKSRHARTILTNNIFSIGL